MRHFPGSIVSGSIFEVMTAASRLHLGYKMHTPSSRLTTTILAGRKVVAVLRHLPGGAQNGADAPGTQGDTPSTITTQQAAAQQAETAAVQANIAATVQAAVDASNAAAAAQIINSLATSPPVPIQGNRGPIQGNPGTNSNNGNNGSDSGGGGGAKTNPDNDDKSS
jgi:hypothetical protein